MGRDTFIFVLFLIMFNIIVFLMIYDVRDILPSFDISESSEFYAWDTEEDQRFIGPQHGFKAPAYTERRSLLQMENAQYTNVYDRAWTHDYPRLSCWGCHFFGKLADLVSFHTVLDAGTGNGMGVRMLRALGKNAYGIELSKIALEQDAKDLLQREWVRQGSLRRLPYADNQFDAVLSADVLEHLTPDIADATVGELVRVSRRHVLMSISLKTVTDNKHTLLRPRSWWHDIFRKHGAEVNYPLLKALQLTNKSVYPVPSPTECQYPGNAEDGGVYTCCKIQDVWLVGLAAQQNVRDSRYMTLSDGEIEPWYFVFRKVRNISYGRS
ncbi:hypothetical protein CYMTET_3080 [Cymbomonas tetramitiformis]|uniref:Methyltransferase type 11 domain-containing protein n=1 Tax=Cymbomonas tetramitiformis TaxID=36881 RepID=A0AAE0H3X6_9CHLO|nr:hypothetical protein CYMTET_3080 [Cymbomonas tetramitiformis]